MGNEGIKISKGGASVKVIKTTDTHVYLLIYVRDEDRTWYSLKVRVPVEKFKSMG